MYSERQRASHGAQTAVIVLFSQIKMDHSIRYINVLMHKVRATPPIKHTNATFLIFIKSLKPTDGYATIKCTRHFSNMLMHVTKVSTNHTCGADC